jgi:hypothetical protein
MGHLELCKSIMLEKIQILAYRVAGARSYVKLDKDRGLYRSIVFRQSEYLTNPVASSFLLNSVHL